LVNRPSVDLREGDHLIRIVDSHCENDGDELIVRLIAEAAAADGVERFELPLCIDASLECAFHEREGSGLLAELCIAAGKERLEDTEELHGIEMTLIVGPQGRIGFARVGQFH
jgi:hypothetical protein